MTEATALSFVGDTVRRNDHDRYLLALFAPAEAREDLFALFAFNVEIAKTREVVSEPTLGLIRLQWWRDAIEVADKGTASNEIVAAVAQTIRRRALPKAAFERLIDARERDLDDAPPADLSELEAYVVATTHPLAETALRILGVEDAASQEAARAAASAHALAGLLRATPFHVAARRQYLPEASMTAAGVDRRGFWEMKPGSELKAVARAVAETAWTHLRTARALRPQVDRRALPFLLTASLAESYLRALARADYDLFDARLAEPPPWRQAKLALASLIGRY